MEFIVCIKQVPDTTEVRVDPETNTLIREGVPAMVNPFDLYAVEEALQFKEKAGGEVIAISMGPPQAEQALREVISMGVDRAILVSDAKFAGADTWATALTLSAAIRKIGDYDVILTGKQAADGDTAQVGPGIAEFLDIPQATFIRKVDELDPEARVLRLQSMWEEGSERLEVPLPCLMTTVKELNEPRLPSLRGKMAAKKAEIEVWTFDDLDVEASDVGLAGSPTQVVKVFPPPPRSEGELFSDVEPDEAAKIIAERLAKKGLF
ncbi:electron transfer flavoprotein subunit beta [candidate division WOR-3 bacterium]|uniref:Electron transfer flavoprotein subunit beta n=1 Tax=candidate division WOR-3 bacterium TaxID=2052148 RepID=A0A9D5KAB9_UNCW3|nr:electron transfer flavoprotein subunit beta [candidate division WOR-3 bacterium]MBD3365403.1 electron transfer flavoprotein subunit beta [candidate division WOR-3 bacterium]